MLTLFQKSLLGTIALAGLLLALVIAAKTPAQATTISPAVFAIASAFPRASWMACSRAEA